MASVGGGPTEALVARTLAPSRLGGSRLGRCRGSLPIRSTSDEQGVRCVSMRGGMGSVVPHFGIAIAAPCFVGTPHLSTGSPQRPVTQFQHPPFSQPRGIGEDPPGVSHRYRPDTSTRYPQHRP